MSKIDRAVKAADEKRNKDDAFLLKARERFARAREYWKKIYDPARDELRFYSGDQWPDQVKLQREAPGQAARPCLTINRLPQFHNQIVNDYRQSSIGMKASPQEQEDVNTAKTYAGIFKQIEKRSVAQLAYVKALSDGAIHGLGYFRVLTEYDSDESFDQDIFIKRVINPFAHYPDPEATGFFLEDSDFWFVLDSMAKDAYEDQYNEDGDGIDHTDFPGDDSFHEHWREDERVITAEYFYFKTKRRTRVQFRDGTTLWEDEIAEGHKSADLKASIVRRKTVDAKVLYWCKIDGYNILEERREWATPRIPIIPVWGNELWVGDERAISGIVRGAMDSQRMYNYWQSAKTEMIALAPKAPYIAAEGQLEGHEDEWKNSSINPQAVLIYKAKTVDGIAVPPPQRNAYEAPVQAIIQASMQSSDDMKAALGIYDASLGAKGNEVSGRAINARKQQGATATYNYVDNLALAIGYGGLVVAELIPKIYDTERQIRIVGEDGKTTQVTINKQGDQKSPQVADIKYDLVLDTGPSYATQREETSAILTELARNFPKIFEVAGDIAVKNMSFNGAQEISDRLKRTVPPAVIGDDEDPSIKLAAMTTMVEQLKVTLEATTKHAQELEDEAKLNKLALADKSGELKIKQQEVDIKKQEAKAKLIAATASAEDGQASGELLKAALDAITELHGTVHGLGDMMQALAEPDAAASPDPTAVPPQATPGAPPAPVQEEPQA